MATIPQIVARRSLDTGNVVQYPTGSPVGEALTHAGGTLFREGARLQEMNARQERFAALIGFDGLSSELAGTVDEAKRTMEPGAVGLHDKLLETYDKRTAEWLGTIPQQQRAEFQARIAAKREEFSRGAATTEFNERVRFQADGVNERVGAAKNDILKSGPDTVAGWTRDVNELIDLSEMSPADKAKAKRTIQSDLEKAGFIALKNQDPAAAERVARGWGANRNFTGSAVDRTMQLLRQKEGFRDGTYWDVNAHRIGYGSDTITDASGTVRRVQQGDRVTREDAERDLARRSQESLNGVRRDVGDAAFSKLSPNQVAALGSMAYNYGSLPRSVVTAVQTGDAGNIADAIRARSVDNGGVNRSRRLDEAALAGTPDGQPVPEDARFRNISAEDRLVLAGQAQAAVRQDQAARETEQTARYNASINDLQTRILDNQATLADVQKARQDGWLNDAGDIQKLVGLIERRDKGTEDVRRFNQALATRDYVWNTVDKDHKDMAEAGFQALGGDMPALQTVFEKTGIVPQSAATALRGAILSNDPQRAENALQVARNLISRPNAFAGVQGGNEIENNAVSFRQYVEHFGMTPREAAAKILKEQSPEYQAQVKARIKNENVDEIVRKQLSVSDMRGVFDDSFLGLAPNPSAGYTPEARQEAFNDFAELFRDRYMQTGDISLAKAQAGQQMRRVWGVSNVNGSATVMRFAPENAPAYRGIPDVSQRIATQARDAIKEEVNADVPREKIMLSPVVGGQTANAYLSGQPVPYTLSWADKNGVVQFLNPGRAFVADPARMRTDVTEGRRVEFEHAREQSEVRTQGEGQSFRERQRAAREATHQAVVEQSPAPAPEPPANTDVVRDDTGRISELRTGRRRMKVKRDERGRVIGLEAAQ